MNLINNPSEGLMIYNTTISSVCWYDGTTWVRGSNRDGKSCGFVDYEGYAYQTVIIGTQC